MSEVSKIDVWAAHGDGGENSIGPIMGYCSTKDLAEAAAKGKAWYGGNGFVSKKAALLIDGKVWILAERDPINLDSLQAAKDAILKADTLASLTPDQRRTLGFK